MKLLLDTHVLLRVLGDADRLSAEVARRIADGTNDVHVSADTAYEIAIKHALGKLRLPADPEVWLRQPVRRVAVTWLAIEPDDALLLGSVEKRPLLRSPADHRLAASREPKPSSTYFSTSPASSNLAPRQSAPAESLATGSFLNRA